MTFPPSFSSKLLLKWAKTPTIHLAHSSNDRRRKAATGSWAVSGRAGAMTAYGSLCDDFGIYSHINFKLDQSWTRESVLHFCDSLRRAFPSMTDFDRKEGGEYTLEEDRELGTHRTVTLEAKRLNAGFVNPEDLESADQFHETLWDIAPAYLNISPLDVEAFDATACFDFNYSGNHDEVVAEALGLANQFEGLLGMPGARILNYEPTILMALDEQCKLQCRLNIETRTSPFMVRTGQFGDAPISVYFTIRQYWARNPSSDFKAAYQSLRKQAADIIDAHVIPSVIRPLAQTIATRQ